MQIDVLYISLHKYQPSNHNNSHREPLAPLFNFKPVDCLYHSVNSINISLSVISISHKTHVHDCYTGNSVFTNENFTPQKIEMQILLKFNEKSYKVLIFQLKRATEAKNCDEHIYFGMKRWGKNPIL